MSLLSTHPTMLNGPYRENQLVLRDITEKEPGEHDEVSEERLTISHHIKVHQFNPCVCTMSHPPNWRPHSLDPGTPPLCLCRPTIGDENIFPDNYSPLCVFDACWFLKPFFTCVSLRSKLIRLPIVIEETTNAGISFLIPQVEILPSEKEREEGVFWTIK